MLDIQRNWQSKLSNVPLSINVFSFYIISIILFQKNFTTKNGILLNVSAIYLKLYTSRVVVVKSRAQVSFRPPDGHPRHGRVGSYYGQW